MIRYFVFNRILCRWISVTTTRAVWLATPRAVGVWACRGVILGLGVLPAGSGAYTPAAGMVGPPPVAVYVPLSGGYQPAFPAPWGFTPTQAIPSEFAPTQETNNGHTRLATEMGAALFPAPGATGRRGADHGFRVGQSGGGGVHSSPDTGADHAGVSGDAISEPGVVLIFGVGLLVLGMVRRMFRAA